MTPHSATADDLSLYQSSTCWFCAKVRQKMSELGINIEIRDVGASDRFRDELVREAGKSQVPCLRIAQPDGTAAWMYESADICAYLERRFSASGS